MDTAAFRRVDVNERELQAEFGRFAEGANQLARVGCQDTQRLGNSRRVNYNISYGGNKP